MRACCQGDNHSVMLCEKQRRGGTKEAGAWKGTYKNWERISFKNGAIVVHLQVIHKQI